jgi:hypothetical protein
MAEIHSAFVSQVEKIDFDDLARSVEGLAGQEITAGRASLQIGELSGHGFAGAAYYRGTLRTGSLLVPSVNVELVVSPWSSTRSEIGIRPLTNLGRIDSLRSNRFYGAARSVLQVAADRVRRDTATADSAALVLAA